MSREGATGRGDLENRRKECGVYKDVGSVVGPEPGALRPTKMAFMKKVMVTAEREGGRESSVQLLCNSYKFA